MAVRITSLNRNKQIANDVALLFLFNAVTVHLFNYLSYTFLYFLPPAFLSVFRIRSGSQIYGPRA